MNEMHHFPSVVSHARARVKRTGEIAYFAHSLMAMTDTHRPDAGNTRRPSQ